MTKGALSKIAPMTENGNNCPTSEHAAGDSGPILAYRFLSHPSASTDTFSQSSPLSNATADALHFINANFCKIVPPRAFDRNFAAHAGEIHE